jgi:hypothetical protein
MLIINGLGSGVEPCPNEGQQPREADLLQDGAAGAGVGVSHEFGVAGTYGVK